MAREGEFIELRETPPVDEDVGTWSEDDETSFGGGDQVVIENQSPTWARGMDMPAGITADSIADAATTEIVKNRWLSFIRSTGLRANLEFRATTDGHLFVRWGGHWVQLTWKNNPKNFLQPSVLRRTRYGGVSFARAIGITEEEPAQIPASAKSLAQEIAEAEAAPDAELLAAYARLRAPIETFVAEVGTMTEEAPEVQRALDTINAAPLPNISEPEVNVFLKRKNLPTVNALNDIMMADRLMRTASGRIAANQGQLVEVEKMIERQKKKVEESRGLNPEVQRREEVMLRQLEDTAKSLRDSIAEGNIGLRTQIGRMKETLYKMVHIDRTLREKLRTLFREQGVTVMSIITAIGLCISSIVLAIKGMFSGAEAPAPPPPPPPPGPGVKAWFKQRLLDLGQLLAKLGEKAAAAIPGIVGSIVSWIFTTLGKAAVWVAGNLWVLLVALGGIILAAMRAWIDARG